MQARYCGLAHQKSVCTFDEARDVSHGDFAAELNNSKISLDDKRRLVEEMNKEIIEKKQRCVNQNFSPESASNLRTSHAQSTRRSYSRKKDSVSPQTSSYNTIEDVSKYLKGYRAPKEKPTV